MKITPQEINKGEYAFKIGYKWLTKIPIIKRLGKYLTDRGNEDEILFFSKYSKISELRLKKHFTFYYQIKEKKISQINNIDPNDYSLYEDNNIEREVKEYSEVESIWKFKAYYDHDSNLQVFDQSLSQIEDGTQIRGGEGPKQKFLNLIKKKYNEPRILYQIIDGKLVTYIFFLSEGNGFGEARADPVEEVNYIFKGNKTFGKMIGLEEGHFKGMRKIGAQYRLDKKIFYRTNEPRAFYSQCSWKEGDLCPIAYYKNFKRGVTRQNNPQMPSKPELFTTNDKNYKKELERKKIKK